MGFKTLKQGRILLVADSRYLIQLQLPLLIAIVRCTFRLCQSIYPDIVLCCDCDNVLSINARGERYPCTL